MLYDESLLVLKVNENGFVALINDSISFKGVSASGIEKLENLRWTK
tara:strand:+ start:1203 stop:1340 length:138 start_codon:yes stop_codon:yes gene_type:complete